MSKRKRPVSRPKHQETARYDGFIATVPIEETRCRWDSGRNPWTDPGSRLAEMERYAAFRFGLR